MRHAISPSRILAAFFVSVILILASLTGCKREANQVPAVQGGQAIDAREKPTGFVLLSAAHMSGDDAALVLDFSQPLAAAQSFDELLVVKDDQGVAIKGSWTLTDSTTRLLFPYAEASKNYTVLVRAGLMAADGKILGKDEERKVFTGPLKPAVGFASQGSVLPARDTRGLPVVSVNVKEVDVEFLRVRDGEVANFFVGYQRGGRRGSWELGENRYDNREAITDLADSVYLNRFVLGGAENERHVSYLPVQNIDELSKPGLYFALMRRVGDFDSEYETAIFFISDVGLHLRAYKDKVLVHAASLKSGDALGSVSLSVVDRQGNTVTRAETDGDGNALIAYTLNAEHVLVARKGKDVSVLPFNQPALDLSEFAVAGRQQAWFDVFAWSGRDLYRPGETVRISALMRNHDGRTVKPQPLFLTLKQPDGRVYLETRLAPREAGYFEWQQALPVDVPTGRWQLEFRTAPGAKEMVQGMALRIEEFLPERMKLELASPQATIKPGEPFNLQVDAAYLYGAPAAGNRFTARLSLLAEAHPLEKFPDHHFGDPTITLPKEAKDLVDQALDAQGNLRVALPLPEEVKAAAPVTVVVAGSVYESGGRTVSRVLKRTRWPAAVLVGVRPLFDVADGAPSNGMAGFEVIRVDANGKSVPAKDLKVSLVREHRDYHWFYEEGDGWGYNYTSRFQSLQSQVLATRAEGGVRVDLPVEWGDYRIEILDPQTKLTMRFPFKAGWGWDDQNRGLDARPDKVKLALDKTAYKAGDRMRVTVTPPHPGPGLLIVESDHLIHVQSIDAKPGATFELDVTKEWERHDVYVTALVFRGGSAVEKVTPARAVGVAFVPMDRSARKVAVSVATSAQAKPEKPLPVTVKAPQLAGKQAWVTLSAVDLGIINITRFPVPDANKHFFAQRRLGIDSYDLYGRVIESFEGNMASLRFGGDMALQALPQARRPTARVQTVDLFSGPVQLDARGEAKVNLAVPDFNGTLRVSAMVYGAEQYGQASTESVIRAPILAEISAPRALAPSDRSTLTLDVQNFTGRIAEFTVKVQTEGPLAIDAASKRITLMPEAKQTLRYQLSGKDGSGIGKVRVKISGGGHEVNREFEVPVRAAWGGVARSRLQTIAPGSTFSLGSDIASGLMPGTVNARISISTQPPIPFASALDDLLKYPYGCAEQTTTRGYAALLLDAETAARMGFAGITADERRKRLEGAFSRLAAMQTSSGHFSFWGGDSDSYPILTPYIAEFLLDAREAGFAVPETMLQKSLERLNEDLLTGGSRFYNYSHPDHLRFAYQAHASYVLARVNRAPLGTLRALYDNERGKSLTPLAVLHLGIALHLQGDKGRGAKAVAEAFAKSDARPEWLGDYGSQVRDNALMLALLKRHKLEAANANARLLALSKDLAARSQGRYVWYSTQEQIALARLGKLLLLDGSRVFSGDFIVGGKSRPIASARSWSGSFSHAELAAGLSLAPRSEGPLYASIDVAGIPSQKPAADDSSMSVVRKYFNPDGTPWDGGRLREGQPLIVELIVQGKYEVRDALLVDLLPAGVEVENLNLVDEDQWADVSVDGVALVDRRSEADIVHEEYRDDRYVAAIKFTGGTAKLFYLVRAVTPGTYVVPPPQIEDMYRPTLRGVGTSVPATMTVVQP